MRIIGERYESALSMKEHEEAPLLPPLPTHGVDVGARCTPAAGTVGTGAAYPALRVSEQVVNMARLFEVPPDSIAAKKREHNWWNRTVDQLEDWKDSVTETKWYQRVERVASSGYTFVRRAFGLGGRVAWISATSALVLVVPLVYEIDRELDANAASSSAAAAGFSGVGSSSTAGRPAATR